MVRENNLSQSLIRVVFVSLLMFTSLSLGYKIGAVVVLEGLLWFDF